MSKGGKQPRDELAEAIERDSKVQNVAIRSGDSDVNLEEFLGLPEEAPSTQVYPTPASMAASPQAFSPAPATPILDVVPATNMRLPIRGGVYDPRLLARMPMLNASRAAAMASLNSLPESERPKYVVRVNSTTGNWYLARRPLAIQQDPFVKEMGARLAEVDAKLVALQGDLTERQLKILTKLKTRATTYVKGEKKGLPRPQVSAKALDRLLFRALEMQASRRRAQLGLQMRSARKQRHDLVDKKRTVQLADGSTVNYNKRAQKKLATSARVKDSVAEAKAAARADRQVLTQRNKAERIAIAQAHNNKPNRRDLPPGAALTYNPFPALPANLQGVQRI